MSTSLKDYNPEDRIVCLGKGEPGTGKTVGLASWAVEGPMYIFDCDQRIAPLKKMYKHMPKIHENIFFDLYSTYTEIETKLEQLIDKPTLYKSIFVDGLTPTGRMLINEAIAQRIEDADDAALKKMVKRGAVYVAQIEDYGGEAQGLSNILSMLRSTVFEKNKVNIFVTAHVVEVETRDRQNRVTSVSRSILTGGKKIAAEIPAYFNEIWHFNADSSMSPIGAIYNITTQHAGEDFAKSALPLPKKLDWTMERGGTVTLYDRVMEYVNDPGKEGREEPKKNGW